LYFTTLAQFYNSQEWRQLRWQLISERTNKDDDILYCQHSGKPLLNSYDIVAHHIKPLTIQNVNDFSISLNPENILLVSQQAHNEIHARFGYCAQRKVYIVHGAPCSGKTSFVNSIKGNSDLIIDIDSLWEAVTGKRYYKPNALKANVFAMRDALLETVKTRAGKWERCFIIEGLPHKAERERRSVVYGAELIYIDTDEQTCLQRLQADESRREYADEWRKYIADYFARYQA
jgi:shikimate kinase